MLNIKIVLIINKVSIRMIVMMNKMIKRKKIVKRKVNQNLKKKLMDKLKIKRQMLTLKNRNANSNEKLIVSTSYKMLINMLIYLQRVLLDSIYFFFSLIFNFLHYYYEIYVS
jgi:hypothetical protein